MDEHDYNSFDVTSSVSSLILISGEEEYLVDCAALQEAKSSLASEILGYNLPDELDSYIRESQSSIILGKPRTYILRGVKEIPPLPDADEDTVICVSPIGKRVLQDKRSKRTLVFPKLKAYPDNNEVIKWILKEGNNLNIDLSRIAGALFVNCGTWLRKLSREIEKIAVVVSPGTTVSPDDARSIMCFSAELTPKEIIDAICDGHTVRALAFYDKMQERNDETGWIIAYLQRHILQQIKLEKLHEEKASDDRAATVLSIHPFIYKKLLVTRRGLWTKKSLMTSFSSLCDLDVSHKRGKEARFGLELEIIRLAEEVKDVKH